MEQFAIDGYGKILKTGDEVLFAHRTMKITCIESPEYAEDGSLFPRIHLNGWPYPENPQFLMKVD